MALRAAERLRPQYADQVVEPQVRLPVPVRAEAGIQLRALVTDANGQPVETLPAGLVLFGVGRRPTTKTMRREAETDTPSPRTRASTSRQACG